MAGMLSMASRNIPRTVIRSIQFLEKNVIEVPVRQSRNYHHGAKSIRRVCLKIDKPFLCRISNNARSIDEIRAFRTSAALLEEIKTVGAPPFPDSVSEGDVKLGKKKGDAVAEDEIVMEIETDKTAMPVPAPAHGIIEEILVKDGDTVKAGQPLFKLRVTGVAPAKAAVAPAPQAEAPAPTPPPPPPQPAAAAAAPPPPPPTPPPQRQTVAPTPGVISNQQVPPIITGTPPPKPQVIPPPVVHPPGAAAAFQSLPLPPSRPPMVPTPGVILDQKVPPIITRIPPPKPKVIPSYRPPAGAPPRPAAPVSSIPVAAIRHAQSLEAATVRVPPADPTKEISGTRSEQRVKMNRMRLKIAQRLKEAQNVNAMLTTFNEIDMSYIMGFRKANQDAFTKKYGRKLGFMSVFLKASAYALQDQPVVNAVIDGNEIVYRDYIDISVAVATPKGLVVPVVRNVHGMNYADIEEAMAILADKARKGALAVEDMDGGTFTVSNGGVFGSLMGTPIINPPQSSILGMHGVFDRPVAVKGEVKIRPMMYVALTYDHRLIDGREAVLFLRKIKQGVEDPTSILAGL